MRGEGGRGVCRCGAVVVVVAVGCFLLVIVHERIINEERTNKFGLLVWGQACCGVGVRGCAMGTKK